MRINQAAIAQAEGGLVDEAIRSSERLPEQPSDCKRVERSGVKLSDRLDIALVKTDEALGRANARVTRCAKWYHDLREARGARNDD